MLDIEWALLIPVLAMGTIWLLLDDQEFNKWFDEWRKRFDDDS